MEERMLQQGPDEIFLCSKKWRQEFSAFVSRFRARCEATVRKEAEASNPSRTSIMECHK